MVITRSEMEAQIKLLERGFEALLAMREIMEKQREENCVRRMNVRRKIAELVETVCRTRRQSPGGTRHSESNSDGEDASVNHRPPRFC